MSLRTNNIVESLVASMIVIFIFTITSFILNSIYKRTIYKNTSQIENHLDKLMYLLQNKRLTIPFEEDYYSWHIIIKNSNLDDNSIYMVKATHRENGITIQRPITDATP